MKDGSLGGAIRDLVRRNPTLTYPELLDAVKRELNNLVQQGLLGFGEDFGLAGNALEARVGRLFTEAGFVVKPGRSGLEDRVIHPPDGIKPDVPLVAEIKSSRRGGSPTREDLRQLDDWVFDLSGEEGARKQGLTNYAQQYLKLPFPIPALHPSQHKGVFIFNGPFESEFNDRRADWLGANEEEFAAKRNFCVISLPVLLQWHELCERSQEGAALLWRTIHETSGLLPAPSDS